VDSWEASWEVGFPATEAVELLLALVVRDLAHGASFDLQLDDAGNELAIDFTAGDEYEDGAYHLLLSANVTGPVDSKALQGLTEQVLEDFVMEAESMVADRVDLGSKPTGAVDFRPVPEDDERWDLLIPDWLAPDGCEVPFGFKAFDVASGELWPTNDVPDAHGRVVIVPENDQLRLFGIPVPEEWNGQKDAGLPIHPDGE
jgi:hypothetical protein